jgi:hypothetical protein
VPLKLYSTAGMTGKSPDSMHGVRSRLFAPGSHVSQGLRPIAASSNRRSLRYGTLIIYNANVNKSKARVTLR